MRGTITVSQEYPSSFYKEMYARTIAAYYEIPYDIKSSRFENKTNPVSEKSRFSNSEDPSDDIDEDDDPDIGLTSRFQDLKPKKQTKKRFLRAATSRVFSTNFKDFSFPRQFVFHEPTELILNNIVREFFRLNPMDISVLEKIAVVFYKNYRDDRGNVDIFNEKPRFYPSRTDKEILFAAGMKHGFKFRFNSSPVKLAKRKKSFFTC